MVCAITHTANTHFYSTPNVFFHLASLLLFFHDDSKNTNTIMERCPICQYKGQNLRKHFFGSPECKTTWDQQRRMNDITIVEAPEEVINSDISIIWSEDDDGSILEEDENNEDEENNSVAIDTHHLVGANPIPHPDMDRLGFTVEQYCETRLLKILNDKQVPHSTYKEILEWSRDAKRMKYSFEPTRTKRTTQVRHLTKWQAKQNRRPIQNLTRPPGKPEIDMMVTSYDFKTELLSLLESPVFADINNLDLNPHDPFSKYQSQSGRINCFNAGKWYSSSYENMCEGPRDFFIPIIFSYDESVLSNQRASIAPLKFTTSLLNQRERNKEVNWRTLCFIPDLSAFEGAKERSKQSAELKSRRLHSLFRAGMESYVKVEQDPLQMCNISITIAGTTKEVNAKICCGLVVGDIQGGDKICCRAASYKDSLRRICRKCNIPGNECTNLDFPCRKISMRKIKVLVANADRIRLEKYHQYCVQSIWYDLNYGFCKFGIFSAANPTEWLHALDNGLIEYCLQVLIWELLSSDECVQLDDLVKALTQLARQKLMSANSNSSFPRLMWKSGITKLSDITADYKVGMMLTVVVISLTKLGKRLFQNALGREKAKHLQITFQKMLAYRAWLHKTEFWEVGNQEGKKRAKTAIKKCLKYLITNFPRTKGQGWNISKLHEQLHVPDDIERNGPPSVTFSGVVERQHVTTKQHCGRTRKNRATLDKETGERLFETVIINETYAMMENTMRARTQCKLVPQKDKATTPLQICKCVVGSKGSIVYFPDCDTILKDNHNNVLATILDEFKFSEGNIFYLLSEITVKRNVYRATKKYWSAPDNGWFDWVMLRFSADDDKSRYQQKECKAWFGDSEEVRVHHEYAPGRLVAMLSLTPPNEINDVEEDIYCVMETCQFRHKKSSLFSTKWESASMFLGRNPKRFKRLELIKPSYFVGHCLMIPEDEEEQIFHQLWHPTLWSDAHHKD